MAGTAQVLKTLEVKNTLSQPAAQRTTCDTRRRRGGGLAKEMSAAGAGNMRPPWCVAALGATAKDWA